MPVVLSEPVLLDEALHEELGSGEGPGGGGGDGLPADWVPSDDVWEPLPVPDAWLSDASAFMKEASAVSIWLRLSVEDVLELPVDEVAALARVPDEAPSAESLLVRDDSKAEAVESVPDESDDGAVPGGEPGRGPGGGPPAP